MDRAERGDQPRSLGRYELLFRIAAGGMAEVYAARVRGEAGFQKLVAIKRMLPQLAEDEEFTTMFLDEARLAANISSPHCVSTIDLGRAEDRSLYIVMELVVGVTLAKILKWSVKNRIPIPVGVAVELLRQAAHGLHDAHEAKTPLGESLELIHRDVSPQNVLVGIDGRVRLTDFGVARAVQRRTETVAGRVKGKFAYMAPEQLTAQVIDRRADVFSLGVVAWEFFTGQRLFLGEHPAETMDRVRNMPILAIHEVRPDVPLVVSEAIGWALERNPDDRCPSARDLENRLRQAALQIGIQADRDTVVRFVQGAGGASLDKMRTNIKVALTNRPGAAMSAGLDHPVEPGLTPSGVHPSSSGSVSNTAQTLGSADLGMGLEMDASAASAAAHPGDVLPQLHIDGEPLDSAGQKKRYGRLLLGVLGALVIVAGAVIGMVMARATEDETVTQVTDVASPNTAPTAPATPEAAGPTDEPTAEDEEDGLLAEEDVAQMGREAQDHEEPLEAAGSTEPAADEVVPARRPRHRRGMRRRSMSNEATATPAPTATTVTMATEPTMAMRSGMARGLVGLDAFDQGLNMN